MEKDFQGSFPNSYVLNVMSDDHPGIISAVTGIVGSLGGNIDSCSQTVLGGYFTLIMIASLPEPIEPDQLADQIAAANKNSSEFRVVVSSAIRTGGRAPCKPSQRFVVTAFGPDQTGVVDQFSQYLAGKDINIVDLYGGRKGDDFVLIGQVEIPEDRDISLLQADLEHIGSSLGFAVKLQHENVFVATNQLRLTRGVS
jgi:glycine cleavage system transcriptional repressor